MNCHGLTRKRQLATINASPWPGCRKRKGHCVTWSLIAARISCLCGHQCRGSALVPLRKDELEAAVIGCVSPWVIREGKRSWSEKGSELRGGRNWVCSAWRVRVRTKSSRRSCLGQLLTQMVPSLQLSDLALAPAPWLVLGASSPHTSVLQPVKPLVGQALYHCRNWGRDHSSVTEPPILFSLSQLKETREKKKNKKQLFLFKVAPGLGCNILWPSS